MEALYLHKKLEIVTIHVAKLSHFSPI